jgi:hypothetical protein
MDRFKDDNEILKYISGRLEGIGLFEEHRLYKEEQIQGSMNTNFKVRNSVEWIIRMNKILKFIVLSLSESLKYSMEIENPIEESELNDIYSYHLENSVYRVLVLWDMYKQLVNEFYSVGFSRHENYSIYKLIKRLISENVWTEVRTKNLDDYIDSKEHQYVRDYLRNSFTHSVDPTSMFIFHDLDEQGIVTPDLSNIIPRRPLENITRVLDDVVKATVFINEVNKEIADVVNNTLILVEPTAILRCGREEKLPTSNIGVLIENKELIGICAEKDHCKGCKYLIKYEDKNTCKPKVIKCQRIYEDAETTIEILNDRPII